MHNNLTSEMGEPPHARAFRPGQGHCLISEGFADIICGLPIRHQRIDKLSPKSFFELANAIFLDPALQILSTRGSI